VSAEKEGPPFDAGPYKVESRGHLGKDPHKVREGCQKKGFGKERKKRGKERVRPLKRGVE